MADWVQAALALWTCLMLTILLVLEIKDKWFR